MEIKCEKCEQPNREVAKFCKVCGAPIQNLKQHTIKDDFKELIGLSEIKQKITSKITVAKKHFEIGRKFDKRELHTILIGNTGTGKSKIPIVLAHTFFNHNLISKPNTTIVNAVDFGNYSKDLSSNLIAAKGGIVFFDEVHKLVPGDYIPGQTTQIDKLYAEMDKMNGDPIIFLAARPEGFEDYLEKNPEVKNRFNLIFNIPDLSEAEMFEMAENLFNKSNFSLCNEAQIKLKKLFKNINRKKDSGFGNGHTVNKIVKEIIEQHFLRDSEDFSSEIQPEDIKGEIMEEKTTEQIMQELEKFVGMGEIKAYVRNMIERIDIARKDAEKTGKKFIFGEHLVLTGNPGTGKTTLARKLGEILYSIGLLSRGHVVEVDRSKMVGSYVGHTAKEVQKICDNAIGGILFIDEAYTLKQHDNDNFGQEAIDTLLKRMEDDRGKMIVIAAGYKKEMQSFINSNPGLKSRFKEDNFFDLKDYTPEELLKIFKLFVEQDNYVLDANAEIKLKKLLENKYDNRDKNFGNGRDVRNLYEKCLSLRANRITKSGLHDLIIYADDIPLEKEKTISLDDVLQELNALVGLKSVKNEIKKLIDYIEVEKVRTTMGGVKTTLNIHFIFKGNPGTGKTTVARILAKIFKSMGLLSRGQLIETDRKDLVAEYVGHTAPKTTKVIDGAIGGILFIDEAYTLTSGLENDFGKEAIETLLKRMEDDRGKFIVIAAGYSDEMENFLQSNPGLTSRFTKHIYFDDYNPYEMCEIFKTMVKSKGLMIEKDSEDFTLNIFTQIFDNRDKNFANGRTVRNLFESVLQNQAMRISLQRKQGMDISSQINVITKEDFGK